MSFLSFQHMLILWLANNSLTCCLLQKLPCEKSLPTSYCVAISINVCLFSQKLFNIIVNHNFNPFIQSLIYPFWHFSWSDLPGFFFVVVVVVSFQYFSPPTDKKIDITSTFLVVNHKNIPMKQFFSNFTKDNKYIF